MLNQKANQAALFLLQSDLLIRQEKVRLAEQAREEGISNYDIPDYVRKNLKPFQKNVSKDYIEAVRELSKKKVGSKSTAATKAENLPEKEAEQAAIPPTRRPEASQTPPVIKTPSPAPKAPEKANVSPNRFLNQITNKKSEAPTEQPLNRFLAQIAPREPEVPAAMKANEFIEKLPGRIVNFAKEIPRNVMQGSLGAAKAALYTSPAAVPAIAAEYALPGAIDQSLREEIASEREMPASIKKAIGFTSPEGQSDIDYDVAKKASKDLLNKITGGKGITDAIIEAPYKLAGIETEPKTATEQATRNTVELITALGGPKAFTELVFDHLPKSLKNVFRNKHSALEETLVGEGPLPKSIHESAEKALSELTTNQEGILGARKPLMQIPRRTGEEATPLAGRIKSANEELGLRAPTNKPPKNLEEDIGRKISPTKFINSTEGGKSIKNEILKQDESAYRQVNQLYRKSKELNSTIEDVHPGLVNSLRDRLSELQRIPHPSGPQKQLISAIENIMGELAEFEGNQVIGYKPINNQVLIDQAQSLNQITDYDFAHGNVKNIFKPTISEIQNAARSAAEHSGNKEALESFDTARSAYAEWANTFDNDYIRPLRNVQNRDYSKIYKQSLNPDEFNELNKVFDKSPEGRQIVGAIKREMVEKTVGQYAEKAPNVALKHLNKDLEELEAVLTPEEVKNVRQNFLTIKRTETPKFKATPIETTAAKYAKKKPEDIQSLLNSRSGIKDLRKDLSASEKGKEIFETLKRQKVRDILRGGNIQKVFKGKDLYKAVNKADNYEILSELLGSEEVDAALEASKELGGKIVTLENLKKVGEYTLAHKFLKYVLNLSNN